MNLTLLKKELIGLRFCILLILVLVGMGWILSLFTEFPDRIQGDNPDQGTEALVSWLLLGLFIGMTAFNQEREHQTQGFLDGLAVSRLTIFLHRLLAALAVVVFCCLLELIESLVRAGLCTTSVSGPIHYDLYFAQCTLSLLLGITVVAVGMVLSFTRNYFPLVAGLLILALVLMATSSQSWVSWINSTALVSPTLSADGMLIIPWKQVGGFSMVAAVSLLLTGILFCRRDSIASRLLEQDFATWKKLVVGIAVVVIGVIAVTFLAFSKLGDLGKNPVVDSTGVSHSNQTDAGIVGFASHETTHYDVIFKESQRVEVMKLVGGMDLIYQKVAGFFQNPTLPGRRIVLDMASSVDSHAAGVTNWTKIRVPLAKAEGQLDLMKILRHETAHVFIELLSDGKASAHINEMRAFHEGVATAVQLAPRDEATVAARLKMERQAALADSRQEVPLSLLCDNKVLRTKLDDALVYPLGFIFAKALIEVGGPALPRRVLEVLKSSPPPPDATSTTFWQHVLQECGTSYEIVISTYMAQLTLLKTREQSYLSGFPRLSAKVTVESDEIVIRLDKFSGQSKGAMLLCRRKRWRGLIDDNVSIPQSTDGSFRLKRDQHTGNTFRYLLGWSSLEMNGPVFEPWVEAGLK